ncbi:MAG: ATP-binding protein [Euryarchaeota archaeon]|nr:ATP-binding protein [Euryarchaeota archaeon]
MEFYNRTEDLALLEHALRAPRPQLIRVYGRRRVGKTELLQRILRSTRGLYLSAAPGDTLPQITDLTTQLADQVRGPVGPFSTWPEFFHALERADPSVIVIDEFQNLTDRDLHVAGVLQRTWDLGWKEHGPHLVLCGSSIGMMLRLTRYRTGPLYGRFTHDLHLRPFSYPGVRLLYPHEPEDARVRRFAVFGRTPAYHEPSVGKGLDEAILDCYLSKDARFRDEPYELLLTELRTLDRYSSILAALGQGSTSLSELEHRTGVRAGGLTPYLEALGKDLDLIRPESPVCGLERRTRYELSDPFFSFYFRFVRPNRHLLEQHGQAVVLSRVQRDLEDHVGRAFEAVVRDVLESRQGSEVEGHPLRFDRIGRWWNRVGEEIDLVVSGPEEIWCGEVKWSARPVGEGLVRDLVRKSSLMERTDRRPVRPFIVARGGATREACALVAQRGGFVLDLEALGSLAARGTGVDTRPVTDGKPGD